ncbi:MAG: hypothetical protein IJ083_01670 [Clostridia bacterium]|nr:hypothetical protein [Clostridia bacterium]
MKFGSLMKSTKSLSKSGFERGHTMQELKIRNKEQFIELLQHTPIQNIISMEVATYEGSYLDGVSWDCLKYIYKKDLYEEENARNRGQLWATYERYYREPTSQDSLLSDFDELKKKGNGSWVNITYEDVSNK